MARRRATDTADRRDIFLLSPASLSGRRAEILLRPAASFELAVRLRESGAPLGDIFSFVSGLYFRGKLAYAREFSATIGPPEDSVLIITATHGLLAPHTHVNRMVMEEMAGVPIKHREPRYRLPLERDLENLRGRIEKYDRVILLGSVATPKYLEPLGSILGKKLMLPADFVGRGDMSRGSLMLGAVREKTPLSYIPASELSRNIASKRCDHSGAIPRWA